MPDFSKVPKYCPLLRYDDSLKQMLTWNGTIILKNWNTDALCSNIYSSDMLGTTSRCQTQQMLWWRQWKSFGLCPWEIWSRMTRKIKSLELLHWHGHKDTEKNERSSSAVQAVWGPSLHCLIHWDELNTEVILHGHNTNLIKKVTCTTICFIGHGHANHVVCPPLSKSLR